MFTPHVQETVRELRKKSARLFVALLAAVVVGGLCSSRLAWGDERSTEASPTLAYVPGHGLQIGQTGLTLGGYANAEVEKPEGSRAKFVLEELALLINWDGSRHWHFFSETELEGLLIVDERGRARSGDDLVIQKRLYLDYTWSNRLNIRVGKFLTPVGIWNVVHAAPLVWTVSRPLATTTQFFDEVTTGVMVYGSERARGFRVDYSLYGQPTDQLVTESNNLRSARRGAGARVQLSSGGPWTVGMASLAQDNEVLQQWEYVGGADFKWQRDNLELWSEFTANTPVHAGRGTDWALYTQATLPLVSDFYAIGRYERAHLEEDVNVGVLGLAYRPWPTLVIKTEYRFSDRRFEGAERGFAAALALLF